MQFESGKPVGALLTGRKRGAQYNTSTKPPKLQPILDYILDHVENDERPYLKVQVLGSEMLGLLDSDGELGEMSFLSPSAEISGLCSRW